MNGPFPIRDLVTRVLPCLAVLCGTQTYGQSVDASTEPLKYVDVFLRNDTDLHFMRDAHLRAMNWSRENNAQVYETFRHPLGVESRRRSDTMAVLPSHSWRLELAVSSTYDTISVLAFTPNVQSWYNRYDPTPWQDHYKTAPLYSLPLAEYHNFLTPVELSVLDRIVEKALLKVGRRTIRHEPGDMIVAVKWTWDDHPEWVLFNQDKFHAAPYSCVGRQKAGESFAAPYDNTPLSWAELRKRVEWHDTTGFSNILIGGKRPLTTIHFALRLTKLDRKGGRVFDVKPFAQYHVLNEFLGLEYAFNPYDPTWRPEKGPVWMRRSDVVRCYGNPLLDGWLSAVFVNEWEKLLLED